MKKESEGIRDLIERLQRLGDFGSGAIPPSPPLQPGGGDGNYNPMEPRVAKLEADTAHLVKQVDRLADVPAKLAELGVKVDNLPTKDWVGQMMRNWLVAAVAFLTLVTIAAKFINI